MIMNKIDNKMKRFYFTIIALLATLVAGAQTIKVYEYDDNGNLSNTPVYTSDKKVKVVFEETLTGITDGHEWVNLGLPSGTLWATCNVGANSPEEYGDYFAWGETIGYNSGKIFNWSSYKWCKGTLDSQTKYCTNSNYGTVDNKSVLEASDDAASVNWSKNWEMPTIDQLDELFDSEYTYTEWTSQNGIYGCEITSRSNGKTIFVPAAGSCSENSLGENQIYDQGVFCVCWSKDLSLEENDNAFYSLFCSNGSGIMTFYRNNGRSVRPVRVKK